MKTHEKAETSRAHVSIIILPETVASLTTQWFSLQLASALAVQARYPSWALGGGGTAPHKQGDRVALTEWLLCSGQGEKVLRWGCERKSKHSQGGAIAGQSSEQLFGCLEV